MAEPLVIQSLKDKRGEIHGRIAACQAQIAQAKHDLAHINASIRLFTDPEHQRARYIVSHGFFKKGEIADICLRHLEIDGEMTTRELAERVMIERKLDATDTTLRKLGCLQGRPSPASCRQTSTGSHGREAQRNVSLGSRRRHYATRRCQ
jgi:hypothetical protein